MELAESAPELRRSQISTAAAFVCGSALTLSFLLPMPSADGRIAHLPSVCLFHAVTGLPCPACGLTRSFVCLAHGHLTESLRYHPLGPLLFAVMLATVIYALAERLRPGLRVSVTPHLRGLIPLCAVVIFLIAWVFRLAGVDPLPN